ncbi:hypothetical protein [Rhizobium ecuadorense]|uniref:hypothetical protein n=1 Tax=Rhizobium ecuadorense TaxID=1671795 RepID=UPI0006732390|nr:hypothetical protein [Rhizobium ecuadorense]
MLTIKYGSGIQAFGNSIPFGYNASSGAGYVNRMSAWVGGAVENRAIGSTGVKSIAEQGYTYHPYGSRSKLCIWDGPLNDIRGASAAALDCIKPALDAFLSSAFMGGGRPASHSQVIRSGTWSALSNAWGGKAFPLSGTPLLTTDPNASLTFSFTGPNISVHAFSTGGVGNYGNLNIEIDGVSTVFEIQGKAKAADVACAAAKAFFGLGAGAHTIKISPVGAGNTVVDCIGIPYAPNFAPVLVGQIPYITNWTQYGAIGTKADVDAANIIIANAVDEWKAAGFPVECVNTNDFYDAVTGCDTDGIHPTNIGHLNYATGYLSKIRIIP